MNEYIEVGQPLQFTDPNTPTRVGEIVENVSDIYNIPSPRLGMHVFVKSEKKSFVITSLKDKAIGGVDVPEAAVEAFELVGAKSFTWNNDNDPSNMNDFTVAGVYDIKGERKRDNDNLPILNTGGGHTFNARLTVLDSSIPGDGKEDDKCITQVMSFNNRLGQGEVYIRTGKGASLDNLTWENWSTLQRNVNVGQVYTLDNLIDNGIYSGVYVGTGNKFTFVMVVINDYALAAKLGADRVVNQFLYAVEVGGVVRYTTRQKIGGAPWKSEEILNKDEISSMIDNAIKGVIADAPEAFDTLKEIADWITNDKTGAVALANAIAEEKGRAEQAEQAIDDKIDEEIDRSVAADQDLLRGIDEEVRRATEAEGEINQNAIAADSLGYNTTTNDISLEYKTLDGKSSGSVTFPAATTEKAGVMSAEDKVSLNASIKNVDVSPNTDDVELDFEDNTNKTTHVVIPAATTESAGVMSAKDKVSLNSIPNEIEKIKDGDTIVGQAREIHSRNGKTVTDSFLVRTTAGSGTIGDGVASVKQIGGNIVKNLVDGTFGGSYIHKDVKSSPSYPQLYYYASNYNFILNHVYYFSATVKTDGSGAAGNNASISVNNGGNTQYSNGVKDMWHNLSIVGKYDGEGKDMFIRGILATYLYVIKPLLIDLTEMFGADNELDQATCDKLFGTIDALPQGLTIANPNVFTSTGFNQFNPNSVLEGKAIVDNAIVSGDKKIAVIPCLPCSVGVGENNGYCIHGEFGEDIKVYLTPLNPMEVEGELYMHELAKDATTDTYVPLIKGYMLVEVPTTANLCAHFLWSEDKCERDSYEPYFESKVELPDIPQMSEYGLAGYKLGKNIRQDIINLEKGVYYKRIYSIDLGEQLWYGTNLGVDNLFVMNFPSGAKPKYQGDGIIGIYSRHTGDSTTAPDKHYLFTKTQIYIRDSAISTATQMKSALQGVVAYYASDIVEYPLPKVDNNYISSDYGVEQFDSVVPCNANNLYYMRSLAGETRNFLDRLMAGLGTSDATVVADRILAVVNPAVEPVNVEPETPIEE